MAAEVLDHQIDYTKKDGSLKTPASREARLGNLAYLFFKTETADQLLRRIDERKQNKTADKQARAERRAQRQINVHGHPQGVSIIQPLFKTAEQHEAEARAAFAPAAEVPIGNDVVLSHRRGRKHRALAAAVPVRRGATPNILSAPANIGNLADDYQDDEIALAAIQRARARVGDNPQDIDISTARHARHDDDTTAGTVLPFERRNSHPPRHAAPDNDTTTELPRAA